MSGPATQGSGGGRASVSPSGAQRGFLDAASGLPLSDDTRTALAAAHTRAWADPGRRYAGARDARRVLDTARGSFGRALAVPAQSVLFPAGMAEAVWWALTGTGRRRLVIGAVEEVSVLRTADVLQQRGFSMQLLGVDRHGRVDPEEVAAAAAAGAPSAVVVQDVNIETGVRQPLAQLRRMLEPGTPLVVDARGSLGRDRVSPDWDVLFGSPRMWGGPGGFALVAVRNPSAFLPDAARTDGPAGCEAVDPPVPLIAAAALALEASAPHHRRLLQVSERLRREVLARIGDAEVVGSPESAWITMFTFLYVAAEELIDALDRRGWACASGAACTSDTRRPHHVLTAMGASSHGSLRVSLPPWADEDFIDRFVADLVGCVAAVRSDAGADGL
jgi:cysteine desulfurase